MFSRNHWAKEQAALERKEARYLRKRQEEKSSPMQEKISEKTEPEKRKLFYQRILYPAPIAYLAGNFIYLFSCTSCSYFCTS